MRKLWDMHIVSSPMSRYKEHIQVSRDNKNCTVDEYRARENAFILLEFKHLRFDTRKVSKAPLLVYRGLHRRVIVIRPNLKACPNFFEGV